jgi:hypothetical protein
MVLHRRCTTVFHDEQRAVELIQLMSYVRGVSCRGSLEKRHKENITHQKAWCTNKRFCHENRLPQDASSTTDCQPRTTVLRTSKFPLFLGDRRQVRLMLILRKTCKQLEPKEAIIQNCVEHLTSSSCKRFC